MLLAVATVATAWSGYQSTRWNGEQAKAGARANALRIESAQGRGTREHPDRGRRRDLHAMGRMPTPQRQTQLADFYFRRFRKEFRPAVDAWVATRPLKNPNAPPTPFAMPQYQLAARAEAERLDAEAEALRRAGAPRHPARLELRARCRPVRVVAVLRRHEHQAHVTETARRDALHRLRGLPRHGALDRHLAGQRRGLCVAALGGRFA